MNTNYNKRKADNKNYYSERGRRSSYLRPHRQNVHYSHSRYHYYNFATGYPRATRANSNHYDKVNRPSVRAASPVEGTEEFTMKQIQQTSAIIMRQLLSPEESTENLKNDCPHKVNESLSSPKSQTTTTTKRDKQISLPKTSNFKTNKNNEKFDINVIQEKIINHIMNLNNGKKKNLINSACSGYDKAIWQIQKQKRLEISRALRNMCASQNTQESTNFINSIMPDIGIQIQDLPIEVIEELRMTLSLDGEGLDNFPFVSDNATSPLSKSCNDNVVIDVNQESEETEPVATEDPNEVAPIKLETFADDIASRTEEEIEPNQNEICDEVNISIKEEDELKQNDQMENEPSEEFKVNRIERCCQTDRPAPTSESFLNFFAEEFGGCDTTSLSAVIGKMHFVDECVGKLIEYRQSLFKRLQIADKKAEETVPPEPLREKGKESEKEHSYDVISFPALQEKVVDIKVVEEYIVAATEKGRILYFSLTGPLVHAICVTNVPLTCMLLCPSKLDATYMYVGSLGSDLIVYNFDNRKIVKAIAIADSVQCMDAKWGYVFVGCLRGTLLRYSLKKEKVEFEDKSMTNIHVIKAVQEGPRYVLLVGNRNAPVCVRDALSGLYLRNFSKDEMPVTVYSLLLERNLLYCGTTCKDILVYNFHEGHFVKSLDASKSKGISCMVIHKGLLLAGCTNGLIYAYTTKTNAFVASIQGPGGVILCMALFRNQVIVGTMSYQFQSVVIPDHILSFL
ncbi:uncharacterized protein LOC132702991 isoform X2 [Cylas formicarius]|uniref:uncharacterized protein LOC132702991 isoform X2 n=1 Tax=Cylas formicarius TaxID=197179 RepID=UPI002958AB88|nr:uncharacterized protein LOC132702991 isoform X2 [Cylas formicarius]